MYVHRVTSLLGHPVQCYCTSEAHILLKNGSIVGSLTFKNNLQMCD